MRQLLNTVVCIQFWYVTDEDDRNSYFKYQNLDNYPYSWKCILCTYVTVSSYRTWRCHMQCPSPRIESIKPYTLPTNPMDSSSPWAHFASLLMENYVSFNRSPLTIYTEDSNNPLTMIDAWPTLVPCQTQHFSGRAYFSNCTKGIIISTAEGYTQVHRESSDISPPFFNPTSRALHPSLSSDILFFRHLTNGNVL